MMEWPNPEEKLFGVFCVISSFTAKWKILVKYSSCTNSIILVK